MYTQGEVVDMGLNTSYSSLIHKNKPTSISEVYIKDKNTGPIRSITSDLYINACGAWSYFALNSAYTRLNIKDSMIEIPVRPRKRCLFTFHCTSTTHPIPGPGSPLTVDPTGVYFRPEGQGGRFITGVSPHAEEDDPDYDGSLEALDIVDHHLFDEVIWPALFDRVPAFEQIKVTSSWAGYYDYNTFDQVYTHVVIYTYCNRLLLDLLLYFL